MGCRVGKGVSWPIKQDIAAVVGARSGAPTVVEVDSYNVELKDDEGFLGDRASKGAFARSS